MASDTSFPRSDSDRQSSPELGTSNFKTQYSKKTGRPIRRSAGKAKPTAGYVDSKVIEDEYEEPIETPSEDEDGQIKHQQKRKRKRSPSPEPPPLDDVIRNEAPDERSEDEDPFQKKSKLPPIQLQFNVPLGFHGPLVVKLDRSMLLQDMAYDMRPGRATRKILAEPAPEPSDGQKKPLGFADLPAELRNKIYRHLFVTDTAVYFPDADKMSRSSQFLSTCKLVHNEGCSILYGENRFKFERNSKTRGPFWEPVPKEIGYKDIRQFLKMIGPENLLYLRDISLFLSDAIPSATPHLDHEARRYIRDEHLLDVIRTLRQTKLRKINILFAGRRTLARTDTRFVDYLMQVKADVIVNDSGSGWFSHYRKIETYVWKELKEGMTRKNKLYLPEK
ncbi:uncharacterized protein N0V89_010488 [Didymosphaeria variabile]|uniref:F-box domain-containing protein n=1 Tax=Didymosphaeria variabile TaxID=1932322 RepID=A0A9W8XC87_9PLEO|nr:uncharacterized protein N0V89_010488 [Didymosphaeria variabile]KAJ4346557.1 hypothetical protein N0V89_010488 [Didymosphaeria variabile]